jgi:hypothetical protein
VLRTTASVPQDYFFNELALTLSVNVPLMAIKACYEPECQKLVYLIEQFCYKDQMLYSYLKNRLDFPFYEIMEYVASISL